MVAWLMIRRVGNPHSGDCRWELEHWPEHSPIHLGALRFQGVEEQGHCPATNHANSLQDWQVSLQLVSPISNLHPFRSCGWRSGAVQRKQRRRMRPCSSARPPSRCSDRQASGWEDEMSKRWMGDASASLCCILSAQIQLRCSNGCMM